MLLKILGPSESINFYFLVELSVLRLKVDCLGFGMLDTENTRKSRYAS